MTRFDLAVSGKRVVPVRCAIVRCVYYTCSSPSTSIENSKVSRNIYEGVGLRGELDGIHQDLAAPHLKTVAL